LAIIFGVAQVAPGIVAELLDEGTRGGEQTNRWRVLAAALP